MSKLQTSQAYRCSSFIPALQGTEAGGSLFEFQVSLVYTASFWTQKTKNKPTTTTNSKLSSKKAQQQLEKGTDGSFTGNLLSRA